MKKAPPVRISLRKLLVTMGLGLLFTAGMAFATANTTSATDNTTTIATGPATLAGTDASIINTDTTAQGLVSITAVTDTGTAAQQSVSTTAIIGAARFNASDGARRHRGHDPASITLNNNTGNSIKGVTIATINTGTAINTTTGGIANIANGNAEQHNITTFGAAHWHRTSVAINTVATFTGTGRTASQGGLASELA